MKEFLNIIELQGINIEDNIINEIDSFQLVSLMIEIENCYGVIIPDYYYEESIINVNKLYELIMDLKSKQL